MAAIGISLFMAAGFQARTTAQQAPASTAETLARLSASIAGQYPSVRALVLARGNCILHEYYGHSSPDVPWPVHSVTKSVLSILVGIAIDKGLLRLDQKLPELVAEATERTIDPRAADITLRDLLTMSSGFDRPGHGEDRPALSSARPVAGAAGCIGGLRPRFHAQAQRRR
jgi:CubicO group peptidase (beta-lactamase class C family)